MERIDRKFDIQAFCLEHGHQYTHNEAILFLTKDRAVPETLRFYRAKCLGLGADSRQIQGIDLLIERVERWQREHPDALKVADIDLGPRGDAILAPNEAV